MPTYGTIKELKELILCSDTISTSELSETITIMPLGYREIKKVIFNDPVTIVFWGDGTKTVVKCQDGDTFDKELGLAMAICKKHFGNKGRYNNEFKKWIGEDD